MNRVRRVTARVGTNRRARNATSIRRLRALRAGRHPALVPRPWWSVGSDRCPLTRGRSILATPDPARRRPGRGTWSRPGRLRAGWWESPGLARRRPDPVRAPPSHRPVRRGRPRPARRARQRRPHRPGDPARSGRFRTVGPGTHGELIDEVIGPRGLLNMDGPDHEALRRTWPTCSRRGRRRASPSGSPPVPVAGGRRALDAGRSVDLARLIRIITGRTAYALLGAPIHPTATTAIFGPTGRVRSSWR